VLRGNDRRGAPIGVGGGVGSRAMGVGSAVGRPGGRRVGGGGVGGWWGGGGWVWVVGGGVCSCNIRKIHVLELGGGCGSEVNSIERIGRGAQANVPLPHHER